MYFEKTYSCNIMYENKGTMKCNFNKDNQNKEN